MKVYTYKCESCGSKQYIKTKTGYKCKYCGNTQDVIFETEGPIKEDKVVEVKNEEKINDSLKLRRYQYTPAIKSALIMFFLCYCFGVFGVHKFIEKKTGRGILYLFTMGLMGIGWFIDVVKYFINIGVACKKDGWGLKK